MAGLGVVQNRREAFEVIREAKNKPCADCRLSYNYWIMQFDHIKGKKKFNISEVGRHIKVTKRQLINEINKCQVVCANCHHNRTYKMLTKTMEKRMTLLRTEPRVANKEHICKECNGIISIGSPYKAMIGTFDGLFATIKLHNGCDKKFLAWQTNPVIIENSAAVVVGDSVEMNISNTPSPKTSSSIKDHDISSPAGGGPLTGTIPDLSKLSRSSALTLEDVGFSALLKSLDTFHKRWQVEHSNTLDDRYNLLNEENGEWFEAVVNKTNVKEELADQLGVVLGNILWSNINVDSSISILGVMQELEQKLLKRAKFGYKIHNASKGITKMTHWQKVLRYLEKDRSSWKVLSGPANIHPEIRELLTKEEIETLEKSGV